MPSASPCVWEKAAPAALALKPDGSVPPCVSLAPSELLCILWSSERVLWVPESGPGPFNRRPGSAAVPYLVRMESC